MSDSWNNILRTVFKVKGQEYQIDVNDDISFHDLKKIFSAASEIPKIKLRIFHNGKEYTKCDKEILKNEIPNENPIIFELQYDDSLIDDYDRTLNLRLNQKYCSKHPGKYLYFYCKTCKKSFCSTCILDKVHEGHDKMEKYYYLQNSKDLVKENFPQLVFEDVPLNQKDLEELKEKIPELFDLLIRKLREIQADLEDKVNSFDQNYYNSNEQIKLNYQILYATAIEVLDKLKSRLDIEIMMLDENIFLTFHDKFQQLKDLIDQKLKDFKNMQYYNDNLAKLKQLINETYSDINQFLNLFPKPGPVYQHPVEVQPIKKDEIQKEILRGVPQTERKKKIGEYEKHFHDDPNYPYPEQKRLFDEPHSPVSHHYENCSQCSSLRKKRRENIIEPDEPIIRPGTYEKYFCMPIHGSNEVMVYNTETKENTRRIPTNSFIHPMFDDGIAWINHKNILYISGGFVNGKESDNFYKYDPETNKLEMLSTMPLPRYGHSMCADENNRLYVVGGSLQSIIYYEPKDDLKWHQTKITLKEKRFHPNVFIKEGVLYVFFGEYKKNLIPTFEKGKINGRGELEIFGRNERNKRIFSAIIFKDPNHVYLCGGKDENGTILEDVLRIKITNGANNLSRKNHLLEPALFGQGLIPEIRDRGYAYFNLEEPYGLMFLERPEEN